MAMKLDGQRPSENVEIVHNEDRGYGQSAITRNASSGVITAIDPQSLNNRCNGVLREYFAHSMRPDLYAAPTMPIGIAMASQAEKQAYTSCAAESEKLMKDIQKNNLKPDLTINLGKNFTVETTFFAREDQPAKPSAPAGPFVP